MTIPGTTGLELAQSIRADASLPQPRMVLLTSMGFSLDSEEERRLGDEWWAFALVLPLVGTEWLLRKRRGLD